jgi:subtilisin-like proprotein convertase family protein
MPNTQQTYTYRNGQKVLLEKRDDQFVVRALPDTLRAIGVPNAEQISSISSRVTVPTADLGDTMRTASTVGRADPAYYEAASGAEFLASDRVLVTFTRPPTAEEFSAFINRYALLQLERYSDRDYLFRLTANTGMDPVELIVKLIEDEALVELADHDLNHRASTYQLALPTDPSYISQWHLHTQSTSPQFDRRASSHCEEAWHILGHFGSADIVVGVTDDGCRLDHSDFNTEGKFAAWGYFQGTRLITRNDIDADPNRMYQLGANHGTSCAGVIAGEVDAALTVGAAPGCRLLPIKWESNGPFLLISDSKLLTALNYLADKVDVVSNSWGGVPINQFASLVVNRMRELVINGGRRGRGILFFWAAGNENCPMQHTANIDVPFTNGRDDFGRWIGVQTARVFRNNLVGMPGVMHIAALSSVARRSHYSNYGTGISLCAPTNNVHEYRRLQVPGLGITTTTGSGNGVTGQFGGTSSATPLVAGVAALVLSANAELTALEVESILKRTASKDLDVTPYPRTPPASFDQDTSWDVSPIVPFDHGEFTDIDDPNGTWSPWFGHGRVDAPAAVAEALRQRDGDGNQQHEMDATPNLAIPDHDRNGVVDVMHIVKAGRVRDIAVTVDIAHTWIGDLFVQLIAPNGTAVVLHNRTGASGDNIQQTYTVANTPPLATFVDAPITGDWRLHIADLASRDTGTLKRWSLRLLVASPALTV